MNHEEKINYMRIASGMAGFSINNEQLDLLVSIYELVTAKKGETSIKDTVKVEIEVKARAEESRINMLDKVFNKAD